MSENRAHLWALVEAAARAITDDNGHFDHKELIDEIAANLRDENASPIVKQQALRQQAQSLADGFVSRRKPKPNAAGALFHPDYVLPLGDGKRVWAKNATADDLIAWAALDMRNVARVNLATGRRQQYVSQRLGVFKLHPNWTLLDVERNEFGYVDTEEPPVEADSDDDDS